MTAVNIAILSLLGAALVCGIVELGLTAYSVSFFETSYTGPTYDAYGNVDGSTTYRIAVPGQISFLLFCSIWTVVIVGARLLMPLIRGRDRQGKWVGPVTLAVNALSTIFWLAGFAALAALYGGLAPGGILGALLAFAVIPWLIFLALLILNILTACGVLVSDKPEYPAMFKNTAGHHGDVEKPQGTGAPTEMQRPVAEI